MVKRGLENPELLSVLNRLRKNKKEVWQKYRDMLSLPTRKRVNVNLNKLSRMGKEGALLLVPGKVLGNGVIKNKFTVVAFDYSESAVDKISKSGCKNHRISEAIDDKGALKLKGELILVK